jgi:hypothetical protein
VAAFGVLGAGPISAQVYPSRFADLGLEIPSREEQTPESLAALQKAEIEKWWPIIRAAGIKAARVPGVFRSNGNDRLCVADRRRQVFPKERHCLRA